MTTPPRILIADDQADVLEALRLLLKGEGYQIETASSPAGIVAVVEDRELDVVLMDLNYARDTTSGEEGLDLLRQIHRLDGTLPVVVMTAWGSVDVAVEAMRRGARDFVQKPWENARVLSILRTQIELGQALRAYILAHPGRYAASVRAPAWDSRGRGVYFLYDHEGRTRLARVDVTTGAITTLAEDVGGTTIGRPYASGSFTVASFGTFAYTMTAPDFPAESGEEFLQHLVDNPDAYTYGNDGIGGTMQLAAERIFQAVGARVVPIPFGGAGETLQNFLGNHVDIYGGSITPVLPYVEDDQAKCLLVTSADDNEALPQASGLAALGHPELETVLWRMMLAPEGMEEERAEAVADAVARAVEHPEFQAFLAAQGETLNLVRGEDLRERLRLETDAIGETLNGLGLKKD